VDVSESVRAIAEKEHEKADRVEKREHAAQDGDGRDQPAESAEVVAGGVGCLEEELLGVESVERGDAGHPEGGDHGDPGRDREIPPEAPQFVYRPGAGFVGDDPGDEEEGGLEQGVIEDVKAPGFAADEAGFRASESGKPEPGDDEAEVGGRRVGEQFLDVGRGDCQHGGDGHREQAERDKEEEPRLAGQQGPEPPDEVHSGFHHGRGVQERGDGRRCLHRVGQPDVEGHLRGLGGRADPDQGEDRDVQVRLPQGLAHRVRVLQHREEVVGRPVECCDVPGDGVQEEKAYEHEQPPDDGDQHGLAGRVL